MSKLNQLVTYAWAWMAVYAATLGIAMGIAYSGGLGFNAGAALLTAVMAFVLAAPIQIYLQVMVQVYRQQVKQTALLTALVEGSDGPAPAARRATRTARDAASPRLDAAPAVAPRRPRSPQFRSPFA